MDWVNQAPQPVGYMMLMKNKGLELDLGRWQLFFVEEENVYLLLEVCVYAYIYACICIAVDDKTNVSLVLCGQKYGFGRERKQIVTKGLNGL